MDMLAKRQAVIDRHKALEKKRGSGWHPADLGAERREERGELPLSERPVAFLDDDLVRVVGGCADRVVAALKAWLAAHGDAVTPASTTLERHAKLKVARTLAAYVRDGEIAVPQQDWNGCMVALTAQNVQVVTTSIDDGPTDDDQAPAP